MLRQGVRLCGAGMAMMSTTLTVPPPPSAPPRTLCPPDSPKCTASSSVPMQVLIATLQDVAVAMVYLHAQGFIHCDLKQENILLKTCQVLQQENILLKTCQHANMGCACHVLRLPLLLSCAVPDSDTATASAAPATATATAMCCACYCYCYCHVLCLILTATASAAPDTATAEGWLTCLSLPATCLCLLPVCYCLPASLCLPATACLLLAACLLLPACFSLCVCCYTWSCLLPLSNSWFLPTHFTSVHAPPPPVMAK